MRHGGSVRKDLLFFSYIFIIALSFSASNVFAANTNNNNDLCSKLTNLKKCQNSDGSSVGNSNQASLQNKCPDTPIPGKFYPASCLNVTQGSCDAINPDNSDLYKIQTCTNDNNPGATTLICAPSDQTQQDACANAPTISPDQINQQADACNSALGAVNSACTMIGSAQNAPVVMMANMIAQGVQTNPLNACNGLDTFATMIQASIAAMQTSCMIASQSCQTACAIQGVSDPMLSAAANQCASMSQNSTPNYSFIMNMLQQNTDYKKICAQLAVSPACMANPLAPGCPGYSASDCTNPANSGSAGCLCINNPAMCATAKSASGTSTVDPVTGAAVYSSANGAGGGGTLGADSSLAGLLQTPTSNSNYGSQPSAGGGGGGGRGGGFGGGDPSGPVKKAPNGKTPVSNVPSGSLYGGLLMPPGGGGTSSPRAAGAIGEKSVLGQQTIPKPDFNSFKPNMPYDPSRALAGYNDGSEISGPNMSNWVKVNRQMNQENTRGSLIPK